MRAIEKAVRKVTGSKELEPPLMSETLNLTGGGVFYAFMDGKPFYRQIQGPSVKLPSIKNLNRFAHGIMVKKSLRLRLPETVRKYLEARD